MEKEIAKDCVKALRSGKYKQAKGMLKSNLGGYCCLGVLCDISGLGEWKDDGYFENNSLLPDEVKEWSGVSSYRGFFSVDSSGNPNSNLASKNDDGSTFEEIAKIIEKNWEEL